MRGFIVHTDSKGFKANEIHHKASLRASVTSELVLEDVRVHGSQMLPNVKGLKGPLSCLSQARFGIAWGALGALEAVYTEALSFSQSHASPLPNPLRQGNWFKKNWCGWFQTTPRGFLLLGVWRS
ncbi:MAG: hypothetical protein R2865_09770 [Deinococcales bacterium]